MQKITGSWQKRSETDTDMGLRKSLGHSPIGFSMVGKSNFDFIPDRSPVTAQNSHQADNKTEADKKIASYYLEKPVIKRLKQYCDEHKKPYSHTVNRAIDHYLRNTGY